MLEARLQSIVQQQAQDNALQENRLRQALDTATQELLETKTALADASQRYEEMQSQYTHKPFFFHVILRFSHCSFCRYEKLSSSHSSLMSMSSIQGSAFAREISGVHYTYTLA